MSDKLLFVVFFIITCVNTEQFRFDNYTLYRIFPQNDNHYKALKELQETDFRYDFWTDPDPSKEFVNVMSAPENRIEFEEFLNKNSLRAHIAMLNVQEFIEKQKIKKYTRSNMRTMGWDGYYTFDDIYNWLDDIILAYPSIVTKLIIGNSYEGREIKGIKISHGSGRRAIFLEGGIHPREWISPATLTFILNELLTSDDPETVAAARDFDWYIVPVTNPDGYVWTHTSFRLWRKNRQPYGEHIGLDLNRNWNNNWLLLGASADPSSDVFAGSGPFSEPETRALSEFIRSVGDQLDIYLTFHSFAQMLLLPFGNSTTPLANYDEAINVGRRAMGALSVRYGTHYTTGTSAVIIYNATGASDDWVKEELKVPLVYSYELRDTGNYGFLLPEDQILPNNLEIMDSILELIHQGKRYGLVHANSANALQGSIGVFIIVGVVAFGFDFNILSKLFI